MLPSHLSPAAATDEKTFWQRATKFREITLELSEEFEDIEKSVKPKENMAKDIADLELPEQFFLDIDRLALWEFRDEAKKRCAYLYSGKTGNSTEGFQQVWFDQVKRLAPKGADIATLAPATAVVTNQASLATPAECLAAFMGQRKVPGGASSTQDQIYRIIAENGKLFAEAQDKLFILGGDNYTAREGEATIKIRVEMGSKRVFATIGQITRYPPPVPSNMVA